jgi:hypothetical protein
VLPPQGLLKLFLVSQSRVHSWNGDSQRPHCELCELLNRVVALRSGAYVGQMCGRYDNLIPRNAYSALFRAARIPRSNFPPRYNVAPTDQIPIVRIDPRDGERELTTARWGLIPFWMKEPHQRFIPNPARRAFQRHDLDDRRSTLRCGAQAEAH